MWVQSLALLNGLRIWHCHGIGHSCNSDSTPGLRNSMFHRCCHKKKNKFIYITMKNRLVVAKGQGKGVGWTGSLGLVDASITFRMGKQWGPTVQHRKLCPVSWNRTLWGMIWEKEYIRIVCMYVWLGQYIYVCMYVWLGQFAVQQKLTQHCKSTIL